MGTSTSSGGCCTTYTANLARTACCCCCCCSSRAATSMVPWELSLDQLPLLASYQGVIATTAQLPSRTTMHAVTHTYLFIISSFYLLFFFLSFFFWYQIKRTF